MTNATNQVVVVLDFGGQYKELIARRVRECQVLSVVKPGNTSVAELKALNPIGIILTGAPYSAYDDKAPQCDPALFDIGLPILGLCYGYQMMTMRLGGMVQSCERSEYGRTPIRVDTSAELFHGLDAEQIVLMSHTDQVTELAPGFRVIGATESCPYAAIMDEKRRLYGFQFHPEVENTPHGTEMIRNFLFRICGAVGDYNIHDEANRLVQQIKEQVGEEQVLLALSGGVDSSVCAALLAKAIPGQLNCIFVDHGLMRKNEGDEVEAAFAKRNLNFIRVDAEQRFLRALEGVTDPERKRKIIGEEFVRVFEAEAKKLGRVGFLAQGTIYPDVIESGVNSETIKSHHNVGGLPADMAFVGLVEPLRGLFKDEVRALGRELKLPRAFVERQPFPGPGLAVRCIGEITKEKLEILREADAIFRAEMRRSRIKSDQFFAVLTDTRSVGVMGDSRTYGYTIALRAVCTADFMTCQYTPLSHQLLGRTAARIVNDVRGISRVVYDITSKPPATIEWE